MESQIKRYMPSKVELEGLDRIISKNKELEELMKDEESNLERIIHAIDGLKNINNNMKTIMKQFFIALQQTSMTSDIYRPKYANFKNQELIENLLEREEKYKKIIKSQAEKHNDNSGIEELNNVFSTIIVDSKDKKLSKYMKKTLKDIKFHDDFKPIFSEVGTKELTRDELKQMKSDPKKGPRFNNIKKITTVNVPSLNNDATIISSTST